MKPKAILTFDVEFWFNSKFLGSDTAGIDSSDSINDGSTEAIEKILNRLAQNHHQATFFVLGCFAQKYPELIKKIDQMGHEIACHGWSHKTLHQLNRLDLENEISQSKKIIVELTGKIPAGFRAPNFSLNQKVAWANHILEKNFFYDSSSHPFCLKTYSCSIREIPSTLGGFYFRLLPLGLFIFLSKYLCKTTMPVFYFHPYEFFDFSPKIETGSWFKRKIKYIGTKNAWEKFVRLSEHFNFISIEQYLDENPIN